MRRFSLPVALVLGFLLFWLVGPALAALDDGIPGAPSAIDASLSQTVGAGDVIAVGLTAGRPVTIRLIPLAPGGFPDVPAAHPYYGAIVDLVSRRIINGYLDGDFGPGDPVTRQQFAKMIVLTGGYPVSPVDVCPFTDVDTTTGADLFPDHFVAVAASHQITVGTSPGLFSPGSSISRYQVISMTMRAADDLEPGLLKVSPASYSGTPGWGDAPTHGANARRAEYNGLLAGLPLPTLDPWGNMPRGEVAQVLHNLLGKMEPPALSGTVYDHLGAPLPDATVSLYQYVDPDNINWWVWEPVASTTTGIDGWYEFNKLPAGTYHMLCVPADKTRDAFGVFGVDPYTPGFDPSVEDPPAPDYGADILISAESASTGVDLTLGVPAAITGIITGPQGPVGGASVTLGYQGYQRKEMVYSAIAGADGRYRLDGVPPGAWELSVNDPTGWHQPVWFDPAVATDAGQTMTQDYALAGAGKITGVAIDSQGGAAGLVQVQAWVWGVDGEGWIGWQPCGEQTTTDEYGHYTLTGLPPGVVRICFSDGPRWQYARIFYGGGAAPELGADVTVAESQTTTVPSQVLSTTVGTIAGTVRSDAGAAISNVWVSCWVSDGAGDWVDATWNGQGAATLTDGTYVVRGLPSGTYRICFDDWGLPPLYQSRWYGGASDVYEAADVVVGSAGTIPATVDITLSLLAP